jgi:hypothetical protein
MTRLHALAARVVRAWTWLYTLPAETFARDRRRREIESDVWESLRDRSPDGASSAVQLLARAALGVPDDLLWTCEQLNGRVRVARPSIALRIAIAGAAASSLAVSASAPPIDILHALRVTIDRAAIARDADVAAPQGIPFAFTVTNVGDHPTSAVQVNAIFHTVSGLGLGSAFVTAVGWRGLPAGATSARVLVRSGPRSAGWYPEPWAGGQAFARRAADDDAVHVKLFARHQGRWTLLGDFPVPPAPRAH